jgi:hypothetical protein
MLKDDSFESRRNSSDDAKKKLLERFRTAAVDPAAQQRKAERQAVQAAREARLQEKALEKARREEEQRRLEAEREATRLAEEAARRPAATPKRDTAVYALAARVISDMSARGGRGGGKSGSQRKSA